MKYIIVFGIIIFILFFPFYINIKIVKTKKKNTVKIGIGILSNKLRLFYKINPERIKKKAGIKIDKNFIGFLRKSYNNYFNKKNKNRLVVFLKSLLTHLKFKELIIETKFGFFDAAQTAILAGIIFSIKSFFTAYLTNKVKVDKIRFNVLPVFSINYTEINFNCIIKYKLVYIIIAWLSCIKVRKKVVD